MDILEKIFNDYTQLIFSLSIIIKKFMLRTCLWESLTCVLLLVPRRCGLQNVPLQWAIVVIVPFIVFSLPLDRMVLLNRTHFAFLFTFCCFANSIMPAAIARLLHPQLGTQKKIRIVLYAVLILLFTLQVLKLY